MAAAPLPQPPVAGRAAADDAPPPTPPSVVLAARAWSRAKAFLARHYLPVGLASATLFGFLVPSPGIAVSRTPVNTISICGIFFISGLQLQTDEVKKALRAYWAYSYGVLAILLLTPLTSLLIAKLPFEPLELPLGQALFMAMPTTVSSGAVLTGEAKGNVALAIFLSVVTNVVGVFTVPFFLSGFLAPRPGGAGGDGEAPPPAVASRLDTAGAFSPVELLWKLTVSILLPLAAGRCLRYFAAVRAFVAARKAGLKMLSSALLVLVPWVVISTSSAQLRTIPGGSFVILLVLGVVLHAGLLAGNYAVCRYVLRRRVALGERKAVVINASQKTINTAMSVIQFLPSSDVLGLDKGLLILPCLMSHFVQILMDAYLASWWKHRTQDDGGWGAPAGEDGAAAGATAVALAAATPSGATAAPAGSTGQQLLAAPSQESVDVRPALSASSAAERAPWHDGPPGVAGDAYR